MNTRTVTELLGRLALLKFFPSDPQARAYLVEMACEMATTEDQVKWMVRRAIQLYREWPGPLELRALFCSKFRPADGVNAYSEIYLNGIPSEDPMREQRLVEANMAEGKRKLLEEPKSTSPTVAAAVVDAAKQLRRIQGPVTPIAARVPETKPTKLFTAADLEQAAIDYRREKLEAEAAAALEELGGEPATEAIQ